MTAMRVCCTGYHIGCAVSSMTVTDTREPLHPRHVSCTASASCTRNRRTKRQFKHVQCASHAYACALERKNRCLTRQGCTHRHTPSRLPCVQPPTAFGHPYSGRTTRADARQRPAPAPPTRLGRPPKGSSALPAGPRAPRQGERARSCRRCQSLRPASVHVCINECLQYSLGHVCGRCDKAHAPHLTYFCAACCECLWKFHGLSEPRWQAPCHVRKSVNAARLIRSFLDHVCV